MALNIVQVCGSHSGTVEDASMLGYLAMSHVP